MGTGVFRHRGQDRPAATYWRRRFVALVIGLAVLALIAWALSGALHSSIVIRAARVDGGSHGGRAAGHAGHGAGGSGPGAAPAPHSASSSARPPAAATGGARGSRPKAKPARPAAARSASRSRPPAEPARKPRTCPRTAVVLSLSSGQASFGSGQMPLFDLDVVSTAPATCTFNIGVKYLTLVIKAGLTRIWDSADCVDGRGSLVADLERGVPTVLPISWDRQTSSPGCQVASQHVPAGTYSAVAVAGADASNTEVFRLR
jgi:hypothetical protein